MPVGWVGRLMTVWEAMLEKEKLDVLHICTPHYLHVPMAIEALEKGLDVVMEKPPAISKEQQAQLREVLSKHPERQLA